jgi:methanogenic corrinoid protein MtbC1
MEEVRRLERMCALIQRGLAPAEAARAVLSAPVTTQRPLLEELARAMEVGLDRYDERAAHAAIDRLLASFSLGTVLSEVFLPYLRRVGDRWAAGEVTVAHEHFGTSVLRGRLLGLARSFVEASGPTALLACPEGELHDLGLLVFGVTLGHVGWRVVFLGADVPTSALARAAEDLAPDAVVLAVRLPRFRPADEEGLRELARQHPLLVGGPAAPVLAPRLGARSLEGDPVDAARALAAEPAARRGRRVPGIDG